MNWELWEGGNFSHGEIDKLLFKGIKGSKKEKEELVLEIGTLETGEIGLWRESKGVDEEPDFAFEPDSRLRSIAQDMRGNGWDLVKITRFDF